MLGGSYTAMITPFKNGALDETAFRRMVNWQIDNGTQGLVPMGTTGESTTVTEEEHKRAVEIVVEEVAGRVPVIAGAGSNNPVEALRYAQGAQEAGADAILCVAGYYNRPSQEGIYQHFKYVHDGTDIPIIVYNIPPRTIIDISPETMAKLAALPRVIGVKDATMDLSRISRERMLIKKPFRYFSGEDMTAVAYNANGGNGCISVTANIAPGLCSQMQSACIAGNYKHALELHEKLVPLHQALFQEPSPSGVKYAASLMGLCSAEARLPMVPVNEQTKVNIRKIMEDLKLTN
ncbi:MAG: 4-hydroxy-tetrahydrodipicolinate synthase [Pseudomonadota bacterium]